MLSPSSWYLGHLGQVPVYVLPEALFSLLYVAVITHSVQGFLVLCMVLFTTIVIHEFGHAVIARLNGMSGVTIFIGALGGMCVYAGDPEPRRRVAISLAGPAANLLTAGALYYGAALFPNWRLLDPVIIHFLSSLFTWNLILGLFNLLPIYPLDGGQATLGSIQAVSGRTGTAHRVTLFVAFVTAPVALALATWLNGGSPPMFTLIIVGLLLFQAWRDLR